jgi:hypothetical protein
MKTQKHWALRHTNIAATSAASDRLVFQRSAFLCFQCDSWWWRHTAPKYVWLKRNVFYYHFIETGARAGVFICNFEIWGFMAVKIPCSDTVQSGMYAALPYEI